MSDRARRAHCYAARSATTSTGTASLKLDSDPLGSQFLNDSAEALERGKRSTVASSRPELIRIPTDYQETDGRSFS